MGEPFVVGTTVVVKVPEGAAAIALGLTCESAERIRSLSPTGYRRSMSRMRALPTVAQDNFGLAV